MVDHWHIVDVSRCFINDHDTVRHEDSSRETKQLSLSHADVASSFMDLRVKTIVHSFNDWLQLNLQNKYMDNKIYQTASAHH